MANITLPFTTYGWGKVCGWVSVTHQNIQNVKGQSFILRIDTASSWTLLLDADFMSVCESLGWDPLRYPDIINWIRLNPQFFKEEKRKTYCIAGKCDPIFRIEGSYMYLLDSTGQYPSGWEPQTLLRGTFSAGFLNPPEDPEDREGRASHISLLGIDKLNELRELVWRHPINQITLTR